MNTFSTTTAEGYLTPHQGIHWRSIIGFELAWLALVYFQGIAALPAVAYLLFGLYHLPNRARLAVIIIAASGIMIDSVLVTLNVMSFSDSSLLPGWFILIWLLFALAAVETMAGFLRPWWLGWLLGATGGPLSYLGGATLSGGELQFPLAPWSFVILVVVWGFIGIILGYSRRLYAQTDK
ncbi:DUF2878 domain-containing protein [Arsukibacterium sp.]|uniref:DUF2878 domain-containing protein n=1 Tax=Arsukibacterium sp. TaxID=1977258 RepID=UPI00299EA5D1|nr:DUF2878 domain-containing protein [Arsukibacterium sp.]MDX1676290.1 DUF2878 domain-containing protein [Arsukibacterium sp.]